MSASIQIQKVLKGVRDTWQVSGQLRIIRYFDLFDFD